MGNLEKAGVLVVVALLAVILVVAFLNFPEQGTKPPVLGASVGKAGPLSEAKPPAPKPQNIYPSEPPIDVIRPKPELDRSPSDAPPRLTPEPSPLPMLTPTPPPVVVKREEVGGGKDANPTPEKAMSIPAASGYPKMVKVQPGDSLWTIAVREYGPKAGPRMIGMITDANPKVRPEAIKAGTEIALPAPSPELADAKPRAEPEKKKPTTPASGTKPPATEPVKVARKLPFLPTGN